MLGRAGCMGGDVCGVDVMCVSYVYIYTSCTCIVCSSSILISGKVVHLWFVCFVSKLLRDNCELLQYNQLTVTDVENVTSFTS